MSMIPKLMQPQDLAEVVAIEQAANQFPWNLKNFQDSLKAKHQAWIFRGTQNELQGYVITQSVVDELHILNICVRPEMQGQGLGRTILNHVVNFAETNSAAVILLEVRSSNHRAQQLYLQSGFNEMSVREGYYPAENGREDAVLMAKDLSMLALFTES
ncbi:ribosomal-protein-alanine N-acetyltransferase [Methylophaga sp. 42_8_T64]|nr:ribosomal-protein-alanine N-acetyltransferase [Methylophaga sp. 42_8_T64]